VHKYLWFFILEDIDTVRRIPIGTFWGVTVLITPYVWVGPIVFFGLNLLLNIFRVRLSLTDRLSQALIFAVVVEIATAIHAFGHIVSGKLVHSPMDELLVTALRDVNVYHGDQTKVPGSVHIGRSLGGPVINILVGVLCLGLTPFVTSGLGAAVLASLISTNLFLGLGGLLPLPSVDGSVIWREVFLSIRSRLSGS
jgi:Zn-dependent protease